MLSKLSKLSFYYLFDGAKVRRFPHSHNTVYTLFAYHKYGILLKIVT